MAPSLSVQLTGLPMTSELSAINTHRTASINNTEAKQLNANVFTLILAQNIWK